MSELHPVILVVDDDVQIRRFLRAGFETENFTVLEAESAAEALRVVALRPVDLLVIDLNLPDKDGIEIVERVRGWSSVPIIILSVRSSEEDKVRLLESGADDYVVKPFSMAELLARTRAALRRQARGDQGAPTINVGQLTIDLSARKVLKAGIRIPLSAKEYRLIQVLAQHAGNVVTHNFLMKEVWGVRHVEDAHYLRNFVRKLRQKIEQDPTRPRMLVTELGVGYRLTSGEE